MRPCKRGCTSPTCRWPRWNWARTGTSCRRRSTSSRARRRHHRGHRRPRFLAGTVRRRRGRWCWATSGGADPACGTSYYAGLDRALLDRGHRRHPVRGRHRQRIPLPQRGRQSEAAGRHHFAVGETLDTMEALKYAKSLGPGSARCRSATCRKARSRAPAPRLLHPRRCRDRRRLDQGLHHPAGRAVRAHRRPCGGVAWTPRRRAGGRTPRGPAPPAGSVQHALNLEPQVAGWADVRAEAATRCSSPRRALPDRA